MDIYLQFVIFVIFGVQVNTLVDARRSNGAEQRPQYRTGYACEGTKLDIACEPGHLIHLIRANYGRFSISICNEHGTLDWSVDCTSHRSFRVMSRSCAMKNSCSLPAITSMFGDPCPGTLKYLEAHYQCVPEKTTTSSTLKPSPPPIVIPSSSHNTTTSRLPTTPLIIRPSTTTSTTTSTTESTTVSTTPAPTWTTDDDDIPEVRTEPIFRPPYEEVIPTDPGPGLLYCAPVKHRSIQWNWTRAGNLAVARCPKGATGDAQWQCNFSGDWASPRPDLSACMSPWVFSLQDRVREGHPVVNIASELAIMTQAKPLFGGDVIHTVDIIGQLVSHLDNRIAEFSDDRQRHQVVKELLKWVVEISNNLLNASQDQPWADLPNQDQRQVAAELLRGMEDNALLLADTRNSDLHFSYSKDNVLVAVDIVEMHKVEDVTLPPPDKPGLNSGDSVFLPAEALLENSKNGLSKVVFVSYNPMLGRMLEPQSYLDTTVINSRIVSVSLGRHPVLKLSQPVVVTFKHLQEVNISNPVCVYWHYQNKDWSEDGCQVQMFNRSHTSCACSHLTNFAVLMDIRATKLIYSHEKMLEILSYVGCSISIICLIFTILTFQFFRVLKSDRTTIHKNLCFCLLVAEVVFVTGIHQTSQRTLCMIVAILLHYFFLAAFMWMFMEGFQLYVMLIEVFETEKSRMKYYYFISYIVPAIVVVISGIVDSSSYGTPYHCWLRADNFFIFSFIGPVIAIVLINFAFLGIAIYMMCKHAGMMTTVKNKEQTKLNSIKAWLRGAVVLIFLLGLTWVFGLFYLNQQSVFMAYLFVVFNSMQGLFIFLFHCLNNDKVQKEYLKLIRRNHWLPICLHKSKDVHRRPSLFINSNGSAQPTSGDLSSPQNSWSFRKDRKSSTNSSFLKSSSQSQSTEPGDPPVLRGTLRFAPGGLTVLDCPEYTAEKLAASAEMDRSLTTLTERNYGHLSERTLAAMAGMCPHRQFADHIYETIDDEARPCSLYPQLAEHHIRTHSCTSRQSSGSSDNYPLIARHGGSLPHTAHLRLPPAENHQSLDNLAEAGGPLVMAVLDGERVVCRLQPQELADAHRTQCHKMSQLSTDC